MYALVEQDKPFIRDECRWSLRDYRRRSTFVSTGTTDKALPLRLCHRWRAVTILQSASCCTRAWVLRLLAGYAMGYAYFRQT